MRKCTYCFVLCLLISPIMSSVSLAQLGQRNTLSSSDLPLKFSSRYHIETGSKSGFLIVKVDIPEGSYIYGLSQKKPLIPSKITLQSDQRIKLMAFQPDKSPKVIENDPIFRTRLEKHTGTVQFFAPIEVANVDDLEKFQPTILFSGQVCSEKGFCQSVRNQPISSKFAGFFQREARKTFQKGKKPAKSVK